MYDSYLRNGGTKSGLKVESPLLRIIQCITKPDIPWNIEFSGKTNKFSEKKKSDLQHSKEEKTRRLADLLQEMAQQNSKLLRITKDVQLRELTKKALFKIDQLIFAKKLKSSQMNEIVIIDKEEEEEGVEELLSKRKQIQDAMSGVQNNSSDDLALMFKPSKFLKIEEIQDPYSWMAQDQNPKTKQKMSSSVGLSQKTTKEPVDTNKSVQGSIDSLRNETVPLPKNTLKSSNSDSPTQTKTSQNSQNGEVDNQKRPKSSHAPTQKSINPIYSNIQSRKMLIQNLVHLSPKSEVNLSSESE